MIEVLCTECGEMFSVPDSIAGKKEDCPSCKASICVPNLADKKSPPPVSNSVSSRTMQRIVNDSFSPTVASPRGRIIAGKIFGYVFAVIGAVVAVRALSMNVGVGDVANLDLMNQRTNEVIFGSGIFIAGIVLICASEIHDSLWKMADRR